MIMRTIDASQTHGDTCSLVVFGRRQREAQARTIRQRDAVRAAMPGGTAALFLCRHQAASALGLAHSSIECMG